MSKLKAQPGDYVVLYYCDKIGRLWFDDEAFETYAKGSKYKLVKALVKALVIGSVNILNGNNKKNIVIDVTNIDGVNGWKPNSYESSDYRANIDKNYINKDVECLFIQEVSYIKYQPCKNCKYE